MEKNRKMGYIAVYWGYNNPLILTIDPKTQRDTQVRMIGGFG